MKCRCEQPTPIAMPTAVQPEYRRAPEQIAEIRCTLFNCSLLAVHTDLTRVGSETTTDRPKIGTLISYTWPCRLIQFRIASRRKKANPTPCTSLGRRTGGGLNLFGVDVAHGSTMAESVMRSPKLRLFLGSPAR